MPRRASDEIDLPALTACQSASVISSTDAPRRRSTFHHALPPKTRRDTARDRVSNSHAQLGHLHSRAGCVWSFRCRSPPDNPSRVRPSYRRLHISGPRHPIHERLFDGRRPDRSNGCDLALDLDDLTQVSVLYMYCSPLFIFRLQRVIHNSNRPLGDHYVDTKSELIYVSPASRRPCDRRLTTSPG